MKQKRELIDESTSATIKEVELYIWSKRKNGLSRKRKVGRIEVSGNAIVREPSLGQSATSTANIEIDGTTLKVVILPDTKAGKRKKPDYDPPSKEDLIKWLKMFCSRNKVLKHLRKMPKYRGLPKDLLYDWYVPIMEKVEERLRDL